MQTLSHVEVYGSKIEALIKRHAPRDLFDVYYLAQTVNMKPIDIFMLRKCTLFSCCVEMNSDFRESLGANPADAIDAKYVSNELTPYLHKDYSFSLSSAKNTIRGFCGKLFKLNTNERSFLQMFFDDKVYNPKLLFPDQGHLIGHPGIKWRLQQMSKGSGIKSKST